MKNYGEPVLLHAKSNIRERMDHSTLKEKSRTRLKCHYPMPDRHHCQCHPALYIEFYKELIP